MAEPSESRNSSGCNRRGSALVDLIACSGSTQELDGMDFVKALDELRDIPELKDAMALLELNQTANQKELGELLGCSKSAIAVKLTDMKAQIREHASEWIRETVCDPEPEISDAITSEQQRSVPKPVPVKVLVAAGNHEPQAELMTDDCSFSGQQHEELERLVSDVQETPEVEVEAEVKAEPRRRGRKPRAAAPVVTEELKLIVGGKHEVHGSAAAIAELLKQLG